MTEGTEAHRGAEAIVVEIPEGNPWREVPCHVRVERAGGKCKWLSVVKVYGYPFCEAHGREAAASALDELYADARFALENMEGIYPSDINPEALIKPCAPPSESSAKGGLA